MKMSEVSKISNNKNMYELTNHLNEYQKTLSAWKESCLINAVLKRTGKIIKVSNMNKLNIQLFVCSMGGWEEYTIGGDKLIRFEDRFEDNRIWCECTEYGKG